MKKLIALCALALSLVSVPRLTAQPPGAPGDQPPERMQRRERLDRVERLKQMRLIEELNLGEDDAVRFMAKRKEHEDRIMALTEERNGMLDDLAAMLGGAPDRKAGGKPGEKADDRAAGLSVEKSVADILDQDRKLFDERRRYQEEMRKMLPMEKFARMLVFEREFQAQVRDAMGRSMKRRSSKFDE